LLIEVTLSERRYESLVKGVIKTKVDFKNNSTWHLHVSLSLKEIEHTDEQILQATVLFNIASQFACVCVCVCVCV
jgi:hypothetical protein